MLFSLDENGFDDAFVAPVRDKAGQVLKHACLEGECTCGEALRYLPADDPDRLAMAQAGCADGEAEGCYALGTIFEEGKLLPKDEARARELYELACRDKVPVAQWSGGPKMGDYSPRACMRMARYFEAGEMPPKDPERARFYAEIACSAPGFMRDHAPCVQLALYYATSKRVTGRNGEDAERYFFGPGSTPVYGKECKRPSVQALCAEHEKTILLAHE